MSVQGIFGSLNKYIGDIILKILDDVSSSLKTDESLISSSEENSLLLLTSPSMRFQIKIVSLNGKPEK